LISNSIKEDSYVLLFLNKRKNWLIKMKKGDKFHTHRGIIEFDSLIGLDYGSDIYTNLGERMWAFKPNIKDLVLKSGRRTQVVYPKDLGIIASWTGLSSGKIVIESGTGSGALTIFAANLVRPNGHIFSYDINKESLIIAEKNIKRAGLDKYVTLKQLNAKEGIDVKDADISLIDVGDPWTLVSPMKTALKSGGHLAAISPTINQIEKLTFELYSNDFRDIENLEIIMREIEAREGKSRPAMRMIGHTAYLTFARKTSLTDKD
jgi:tRNA (adenine57-N1/adenine58-N1)-methyltransferase